jgi:hypothetical protein
MVKDDSQRFGVARRPMHHGRRQSPALGVREDIRDAAVHRGNQRIGCAQIYADDFAHA